MNKEELAKVLENHKHWLNEDCEGWENMKANLFGANLRDADLCDTDLRDADLRGADLCGADLCGANLCDTNLCDADLRGADLCGADLCGANLCDAHLCDTDLRGAKNVLFVPYACPDFGAFIGYKKAGCYIVELEILADAKRCSATSRKCRCDKAKVLRILNLDRTKAGVSEVLSNYDESFIYKVGEVVSVDNFCEDRWNECSAGIHFFINFEEAVRY